jgi:hypothetical protein
MQDDPHLVGVGGTARRPVAPELAFMKLDQVLSLTAGAVQRIIDIFSAAAGQRCDNEADVKTEGLASIRAATRRLFLPQLFAAYRVST